jgi:hypothetical protein
MTDDAWMAQIVADAEPLSEVPGVRAIALDEHYDAMRSVRAVNVADSNNRPLYAALKRMSRGTARFFSGTCAKGELTGAYTGAFWRDNNGERVGRMYFFFGAADQLDQMRTKAEGILAEYRAVMEAHSERLI